MLRRPDKGIVMVSYCFYTGTYRGSLIPEDAFYSAAARAEDAVTSFERDYTVNAAKQNRDKAVCAIAEEIYKADRVVASALSSEISGQSIGSVSVSYRQATPGDAGVELTEHGKRRRYYDILRRYATVYRGTSHGNL